MLDWSLAFLNQTFPNFPFYALRPKQMRGDHVEGIFLHTIMKNNDQWFEPGDKVMRVSHKRPSPLPFNPNAAPYGKVFCVSHCFISRFGNTVNFVGVTPSRGANGFLAANFRKVEEIQLCVRAAEAMKKPKKQEEMA